MKLYVKARNEAPYIKMKKDLNDVWNQCPKKNIRPEIINDISAMIESIGYYIESNGGLEALRYFLYYVPSTRTELSGQFEEIINNSLWEMIEYLCGDPDHVPEDSCVTKTLAAFVPAWKPFAKELIKNANDATAIVSTAFKPFSTALDKTVKDFNLSIKDFKACHTSSTPDECFYSVVSSIVLGRIMI